jgi:hypothetical protein
MWKISLSYEEISSDLIYVLNNWDLLEIYAQLRAEFYEDKSIINA